MFLDLLMQAALVGAVVGVFRRLMSISDRLASLNLAGRSVAIHDERHRLPAVLLTPTLLAAGGSLGLAFTGRGRGSLMSIVVATVAVFGTYAVVRSVLRGVDRLPSTHVAILSAAANLIVLGALTQHRLIDIDNYNGRWWYSSLTIAVAFGFINVGIVAAATTRSQVHRFWWVPAGLGTGLFVMSAVPGFRTAGATTVAGFYVGEIARWMVVVGFALYVARFARPIEDGLATINFTRRARDEARGRVLHVEVMVVAVGVVAVSSVAVLTTQDNGGLLLLLAELAIVVWYFTRRTWTLLVGGSIGLALAGVAAIVLSGQRLTGRVFAPGDLASLDLDGNRQLLRGVFSLVNGGFLGEGFATGYARSIPVASSDFVLAAIGNELGWVSLFCALMLLVGLLFGGLVLIPSRDASPARGIVLAGVLTLAMPAIVIAFGVTAIGPLTGVPFPFLARGFASLAVGGLVVGSFLGQRRVSVLARMPSAAVPPDQVADRRFVRELLATRLTGVFLIVALLVAAAQAASISFDSGLIDDARNPRNANVPRRLDIRTADDELVVRRGSSTSEVAASRQLLVSVLDSGLRDEIGNRYSQGLLVKGASGPVRSSVEDPVQVAAERSLVGHAPSTIAVIDAGSGEVLALGSTDEDSRMISSAPGSIFKLLTYGAALNSDIVDADSTFEGATTFRGVSNAGQQSCGGTLAQVIARSCNTAAAQTGFNLQAAEGQAPIEVAVAALGGDEVQVVQRKALEPTLVPLATTKVGADALTPEEEGTVLRQSFGQGGVIMSPLDAARMVAVLRDGSIPELRVKPGRGQWQQRRCAIVGHIQPELGIF